ncbi:MAG: hypothetical protein ABW101_18390 [Candidatus Thiodiazotropha sp.]
MERQSHSYSLRRLNPFNGVLQVHQHDRARALSANGQIWEIQVLSETPQGLWANTPLGRSQYYTFGLWSYSEGLQQVPVNPLFNIRQMIQASEDLIETLQPRLSELPFPLLDPYELWLLDEQTRQPLALLQTCREDADRRHHRQLKKWIAAGRGDFSFVSPHLQAREVPNNDGHNPRMHASILESVVRHRAGQNPARVWLYRNEQHQARPLGEPGSEVTCPPLTLDLNGYEAEEEPLIADYIAWKSPQLLMLPNIPSDERARVEELAVRQASLVDRFFPLYPEIHNKDLLNRARVEAKIRAANRS